MIIILIRIAVFALIFWFISRLIRTIKMSLAAHTKNNLGNSGQPFSTPPQETPYQVLGISPEASMEDIKAAYKKALFEYHPDKVTHLGLDIKQVAKDKTEKIMAAYQQILRSHPQ